MSNIVVENFKAKKKEMEIKMAKVLKDANKADAKMKYALKLSDDDEKKVPRVAQAARMIDKISDTISDIVDEFIESVGLLIKDASPEEIVKFLEVNDEEISTNDKLMIVITYIEVNDNDYLQQYFLQMLVINKYKQNK